MVNIIFSKIRLQSKNSEKTGERNNGNQEIRTIWRAAGELR
jgi:hypothetical protein